jgi:transposase
MQSISTIGLDMAKSVFQVHGVDAAGQVVIRRQLRCRQVLAFFQRLPPCLVGIEACASSHHWSRELQALGHAVRLLCRRGRPDDRARRRQQLLRGIGGNRATNGHRRPRLCAFVGKRW